MRPGDRVGLLFGSGDWTGFAVAFCAAQKAGAVAVPISDRLAPPEAGYMLDHCSASVVVHAEGLTPPAGPYPAVPAARLEDAGEGPVGVRVRSGDLAQILYTSGTTGRPKGVGAAHANLVHGCETRRNRRRFRHSEHLLHAFPIGTNAGQTMLMNALDAHPTVVTPARFTPGRFTRLIEAYRAGTVFVVPAMVIELLDTGLHERHDLSSVVLLGSSAAALPGAVRAAGRRLPQRHGDELLHLHRGGPRPDDHDLRPGQARRAGPPGLRRRPARRRPRGPPAAARRDGRDLAALPAAARSYYGDERASAETFRDGWVRMGDVGHLDADGYLYLDDRESDVVKTGAFKVSTLQVEAALYEHPQIKEAAVVGVAHRVLGSVLAAAVVPRSPDLSAGELRAFLMDRLARHELPERVLVMDALPRNQTGKVIKGRLRELLDGSAPQARTEGA
nr:long-chain fatty acid--CoA ligase [Planobispora longispora]